MTARQDEIEAIRAQRRNHTLQELREYSIHGCASPSMRELAHRAVHFQSAKHNVTDEEYALFLDALGLGAVPCSEECEKARATLLGGKAA